MFISEYVEGSSHNKYIEIYNPTSETVDLSNYTISLYANGSATSSSEMLLSEVQEYLESGQVIVIGNSSATIYIPDATDAVCNFNGDDAIALYNGTDLIDIIGEIGLDPGSSWTAGTGTTANHTIVRVSTVTMGVEEWDSTQWIAYDQDTSTYLGSHTCDDSTV